MRLRRRALALALGLFFAFGSVRAQAQEAETLFEQGRSAVRAGDYELACRDFAASQKLEPAPGTLLNLGDCEERLGRLVSARAHFADAASRFSADDHRRKTAEVRVLALQARLGRVLVHRSELTPKDTVVVRGDEVIPFDAPYWALPGKLSIVARASGRSDRPYEVSVAAGELQVIAVEAGEALGPVASSQAIASPTLASDQNVPPGPPSAPPDGRVQRNRAIGFALGGIGVAGLVTGAVTGLVVLNKASTVKAHCDASYNCDSTGVDAAQNASLLSTMSVAGFAVGAVGLGLGTYFLLTAKPTSRPAKGGGGAHGVA